MCRGCRKVVKTGWQVVRPWTHYLPTGLDHLPAVRWLIIIAASCEMSKNEDGRTAVLLQKILLHRNVDTGILTELRLFSQQFPHVNTNFTASGIFALDFSFLYSTLGSIAKFLVFLTQVWDTYGHHAKSHKHTSNDYVKLSFGTAVWGLHVQNSEVKALILKTWKN